MDILAPGALVLGFEYKGCGQLLKKILLLWEGYLQGFDTGVRTPLALDFSTASA